MRILQIVTYISPDGAYGGPVRVAINQAKALVKQGHEVTVAAAAGGFGGPLPSEFDGFPVHLFQGHRVIPKVGFAGLICPTLLAWLPRALKGVDVVHIHLARDLVTLPAAALTLISRKPLIVQTHGMIDRTKKFLARPLDALLTVPILRGASRVLFLTEQENADIIDVAGCNVAVSHVPNGVVIPPLPSIEHTSAPLSNPEVLFLGRLHAIKRPMVFVRASINISSKWPSVRFTLIGPDEGEGESINAALIEDTNQGKVSWSGSIEAEKTVDRMRASSIFTLPSQSELFSMATLEAMALGLPVVITETSGFASMVRENKAGIVCNLTQHDLENALQKLLEDPQLRKLMGANGRDAVRRLYSMDNVATILTREYKSVVCSINATKNTRRRWTR